MVTMLRELTLAGEKYQPGQEVPEPVWEGLRERVRRSLVAGRYVTMATPKKRKATKLAPK